MSTYGWSELLGASLEGRYTLDRLIRAESRIAQFAGQSTHPDIAGEVMVTVERGSPEELDTCLRRFQEAKYLRHPNLMEVRDCGSTTVNGLSIVFLVTEPAGSSLDSVESMQPANAWQLGRDLVAALTYLHSENLVYCALRPETTWLVNGAWKLGDYHELRLTGPGRVSETRALMGRMPEVPPEAYEGVVTPAWDVWALGVILGRVLRRGNGSRRPAPLPPEFDYVVNQCLDANPESRLRIEELAHHFSQPHPDAVAAERAAARSAGRDRRPFSLAAAASSIGSSLHGIDRRWILVPILGAIVGTVLTVFALNHGPRQAPETRPPSAVAPTAQPRIKAEPEKPNPISAPMATEAEADRTDDRPEQRIRALLERWAAATRARDVDQQMACYTPVVDTFYGKRQLSATDLRTEKVRQFSSIGKIRRFSIRDVRIRRTGRTSAVVSFRKDWDFGSFAGSEKDEMNVRLVDGDWRIASERGRKLYWVRRDRSRPARDVASVKPVAGMPVSRIPVSV